MLSRPVAFGLLAAACILAAAGGSYVATRHYQAVAPRHEVALPASTSLPASASAAENSTPAGQSIAGSQAAAEPAPAAPTDTAGAGQPGASDSTRTETAQAPVEVEHRAARTSKPAATTTTRSASRTGHEEAKSRAAIEPQAPPPEAPRGWPSPAPPVETAGAAPPIAEGPVPPVPPPPATPQKEYEELVVPADSVIGLQLQTPVSTERSRVEDPVEARVTREVKAGDRVAIPAGSRLLGSVTLVQRGGKMRDQARLGIRFNALVLADGTRTPINTETVYREGRPPGNASAAKIGGAAVGGAILGAIIGGRKGAAIGGAVGAGGGTAAVMTGDPSEVVLPAGTSMTIRVQAPITITIDK